MKPIIKERMEGHPGADCGRDRRRHIAVWLSGGGSIALFAISLSIGLAVDSITLLLDAAASIILLAVTLLMHHSIKKLGRPPDDIFNFGYDKYEPFTALIQGSLIIMTCIISIFFAIQDIIHSEDIHNYYLPVMGTLLSGAVGLSIFLYFKRISRHSHSSVLKTTALHWFTDTVLSFCVFCGFSAGLVLQSMGYKNITPYIDPAMAIMLAVLLMRAPVKTITRNMMELLDAMPLREGGKVRDVIEKHRPGEFDIHRLRMRKAGEKIFIDICFNLRSDSSTKEVARLFGDIERGLKSEFENCDVVMHFRHA